jgi:hypothetical protein
MDIKLDSDGITVMDLYGELSVIRKLFHHLDIPFDDTLIIWPGVADYWTVKDVTAAQALKLMLLW